MTQLEEAVKQHIDEVGFNAEDLAKIMAVSYAPLRRKLQKLVGLPPAKYLRAVRVQVARELLEQGTCNSLIEVAFRVGFDSPYYFAEIFEQQVGKKVTDYL